LVIILRNNFRNDIGHKRFSFDQCKTKIREQNIIPSISSLILHYTVATTCNISEFYSQYTCNRERRCRSKFHEAIDIWRGDAIWFLGGKEGLLNVTQKVMLSLCSANI
jgi:hypothetical protein